MTNGWGTSHSGSGTPVNTDYVCVDDPAPGTGAGQLDSNVALPTRDAGIEPGAAQTVTAGKTASVPFTFAYAGATSSGSFGVSASTNLSGASAKPSLSTLTPASTSSTPVKVSVAIPAKAKPGAYTVTLTAKLADGESRTGTVVLNVKAPPCVVPKLTGKTLKAARKALAAAHCTLGNVQSRHSSKKKGKIFAQSPAPGRTLANKAKVSVTTSLGPKPKH